MSTPSPTAPKLCDSLRLEPLITHQFFGPDQATRYQIPGLSTDEAHRLIGANLVAGFDPVVHTRTARGDQLRTPDGRLLTVVALYGSRLMSVIWFEQV
ncbi:hypothetical protein HUF15_40430 [Streptomyces samsunensis]|uniref:hypothetical protein n=1 Tax=Streptomyces malaysiensis TaxID=92644 RepID=UPI0015823CF7|nr:hypothetical protein [Streptomyces samsunensis]NUH42888.1 hypothetical protein [Streptomyces samsunensis]